LTNDFKSFGPYRVSKKLGRLYLVIFLLLSIPVFIEHFNADYKYHLECVEEGQPCLNPFFNNCPSQLVGGGALDNSRRRRKCNNPSSVVVVEKEQEQEEQQENELEESCEENEGCDNARDRDEAPAHLKAQGLHSFLGAHAQKVSITMINHH
jgi:hypothetical protein